MAQPVFRFAPSPNGRLHLGHAYSALLNESMAQQHEGRFLVRLEDIDQQRCPPEKCMDALADLRWLGVTFEEPVLWQSTRFPAYRTAIAALMEMGLLYVCTCSRKTIAEGPQGAKDPEGKPIYGGTCRRIAHPLAKDSILRLRMDEACAQARRKKWPLTWHEKGETVEADPQAWGDVIIARKDIGTSYHLAVVLDDAHQNVSDVVRGTDLQEATAIHRLLQVLLDLPEPRYHHHALVTVETGRKLSKSRGDQSLADLREAGATPSDIRKLLNFY